MFPDYQGVGIGRTLTNFIGDLLIKEHKTYITTTSNPAMIFARKNDKKWIATRIGRASIGCNTGKIQNRNVKGSTSANRITVSFEYIG